MLSGSDRLFLLRPIWKCEKLFPKEIAVSTQFYIVDGYSFYFLETRLTLKKINGILSNLFQLEISHRYQRLKR